ncbi:MAG: TrbI/VirB10 family protein [Rickettsiales bacterium]
MAINEDLDKKIASEDQNSSSGAVAYTSEENNIALNTEEENSTSGIEDSTIDESDGQEEENYTPSTDEPTIDEADDEEEDEEYKKLKEELLKEYMDDSQEETNELTESAINSSVEEEQQNTESTQYAPQQDFDVNQVSTPEPTTSSMEDNSDQIEIEDVAQDLDGDIIDEERPLNNEASKVTPDVDKGISKVAISKGSSLFIMIGGALVLLYIIYQMLKPSGHVAPPSEINDKLPIVKPIEDTGQTIVVPEVPKFPDIPKEVPAPVSQALPTPPVPPTLNIAPMAPPLPPAIGGNATASSTGVLPIPSIGSSAIQDISSNLDSEQQQKLAEANARKQARLKTGIMVMNGNNSKKSTSDLSKLSLNSDQIPATYIGDLQRIIAQGKVIDAVLETAINTDIPGPIRAVVSRDIYSESGHNVLINRGSRIIGSYSSDVKFGQARVQIAWERIIRPDGVDIKVASPGVDSIGRAGSGGDIDNHIMHNLGSAMMMSVLNIGVARAAGDSANTSGSTTNTSSTDATTGTTSSSSTASTPTAEEQAWQNAINNISKVTSDVIQKTMNVPPTITVDQGTALKVFVKRDIIFPGSSANLTRMIE